MKEAAAYKCAMRILTLLFIIILAGCSAKHESTATNSDESVGAQLSPEMFRKIASAPGDDTPLVPKLAAIGNLWTNADVSIAITYQDGRVIKEAAHRTAKTVGGKYLVFTIQSQSSKQPVDSIETYDNEASAFKVLGINGDTVTGATIVYDFEKKSYTMNSSYGDGLTEVCVGSFSNSMDTNRTQLYKKGVLIATRDTKTIPK